MKFSSKQGNSSTLFLGLINAPYNAITSSNHVLQQRHFFSQNIFHKNTLQPNFKFDCQSAGNFIFKPKDKSTWMEILFTSRCPRTIKNVQKLKWQHNQLGYEV